MTELTKAAVFAALAAVKPPLATPIDVKLGTKSIVITWQSDDEGLPKAAADAMFSAKINYDDPHPDTVDMHVAVTRGGRDIPSIKAVYNRMNREKYDAAVLALKPA